MHKHFRMIAISEHLRNHGFDPDYHKHTRIPYIWQKLRTFYNLDIIDERESIEDDEQEDRYNEFSLPSAIFGEAMYQRRFADSADPPSSPPQLDLETGSSPAKKRKRGDTVSRTRGTSREDTEEVTDAQSPGRSTRGSRGRTRAASAAKAEKADTTEDERQEEESEEEAEESGSEEDEEEEQEEVGDSEADTATQSTKSGRGAPRTRGRAATSTRSSRRKK